MKTIVLPMDLGYGPVTVVLGDADPNKPGTFMGGNITGFVDPSKPLSDSRFDTANDVLSSIVLAHACAGIDVTSPAYVEGLETTISGIIESCCDE